MMMSCHNDADRQSASEWLSGTWFKVELVCFGFFMAAVFKRQTMWPGTKAEGKKTEMRLCHKRWFMRENIWREKGVPSLLTVSRHQLDVDLFENEYQNKVIHNLNQITSSWIGAYFWNLYRWPKKKKKKKMPLDRQGWGFTFWKLFWIKEDEAARTSPSECKMVHICSVCCGCIFSGQSLS